MDFAIALAAAAAVLGIGLLFLFAVVRDARGAVLQTRCAPDGVAITSESRLRLTVMSLDRTALTGRGLDGRRMDMRQASAAADVFARQQESIANTAAILNTCCPQLLLDYAVGYYLVASALVREEARREAAK